MGVSGCPGCFIREGSRLAVGCLVVPTWAMSVSASCLYQARFHSHHRWGVRVVSVSVAVLRQGMGVLAFDPMGGELVIPAGTASQSRLHPAGIHALGGEAGRRCGEVARWLAGEVVGWWGRRLAG